MKFLFGTLLFAFLGWLAVRYLIMRLRRMRGEPVPEDTGPRTVTLACIFLILIYAVLIVLRLHAQGWDAFG